MGGLRGQLLRDSEWLPGVDSERHREHDGLRPRIGDNRGNGILFDIVERNERDLRCLRTIQMAQNPPEQSPRTTRRPIRGIAIPPGLPALWESAERSGLEMRCPG
jgi:hypothetical protein